MTKRILVSELKIGMYINKLGGSWMNHPFLRNSFLLTDPNDLKRIKKAGIKDVWIDETKGDAVRSETAVTENDEVAASDEIEALADEIFEAEEDAALPQSASMEVELEKARQLCQNAKDQVIEMFNDVRMGKTIDAESTLPLIAQVDEAVQRNSAAILSVARLKTHDDYTYMHSVAVAALMMALARQLKLDQDVVTIAGVAGLMHDLGKALMPADVLNKPGKLTDAEFDIMKKHPAAGAKILKDSGAEKEVVDVALHHHEKINGKGYPRGLMGNEISLLAKMGAICDVYDAVTSQRAYKEPWDPAASIRKMASWEGHFDKEIFSAFVKSVGIYPVGSLVRLSSQQLAVIVEPDEVALIKPKVRVFFSLKSKEPIKVFTLDLADPKCDVTIEGPENQDNWNFKSLDSLWQ